MQTIAFSCYVKNMWTTDFWVRPANDVTNWKRLQHLSSGIEGTANLHLFGIYPHLPHAITSKWVVSTTEGRRVAAMLKLI